MSDLIRLVGPNQAVEIFGVKLVGVNADNGVKLLVSVLFVVLLVWLAKGLRRLSSRLLRGSDERVRFWARQAISLSIAVVVAVGVVSIWFDDPTRLTTGLGLVTAGLAFALQKVVTALAGYGVILRGRTFNVGDRIQMGGVRGDVIGLGFMQTKIMEMGQLQHAQPAGEATWVRSRQYTGRIVTVTNDKIFTEPVYNYSEDFPFLFEEISVPLRYGDDWALAERILLQTAERNTVEVTRMGEEALAELRRRYFLQGGDVGPRVYYRLTDNWLELTVRFIVRDHAIREVKDSIAREVLRRFREEGLEVASATFELVGAPPVRLLPER